VLSYYFHVSISTTQNNNNNSKSADDFVVGAEAMMHGADARRRHEPHADDAQRHEHARLHHCLYALSHRLQLIRIDFVDDYNGFTAGVASSFKNVVAVDPKAFADLIPKIQMFQKQPHHKPYTRIITKQINPSFCFIFNIFRRWNI
jgi:hypothetical protein